MNPNYNQTITVYNCLRAKDNADSKRDTWQRTVLHDCFYKNVMGRADSGKSSEGKGLYVSSSEMRSAYTARIPESDSYVSYREWTQLEEEKRKGKWTCSVGDIVIKGECKEEITGSSPNTAAEVLQRYKPDSFKVTAFSDNTTHIAGKHYRLGG